MCVFACVRAYSNASVSVPRCRPLLSWPETSPCQTPVGTWGDRQAAQRRCRVDGEGKEKERERGKNEGKEKGDWRRRIRQLFTAISGGQQQSELRSLSASGGTIEFTFHVCHSLSLSLSAPSLASLLQSNITHFSPFLRQFFVCHIVPLFRQRGLRRN